MSDIIRKAVEACTQLKREVGCTMGPNGFNVSILIQKGGTLRITKDGASVARKANHEDDTIHGFIRNIAEVATSVESEVGDGTTTATVMSTSLLIALYELMETENIHPRRIIRDMDKVLDELIQLSSNIKGESTIDTIYPIAKVSTNHDLDMAQKVADIVKVIGPYGRFSSHAGTGLIDIVNTRSGYTIDGSIISGELLCTGGKPLSKNSRVIVHEGELTKDNIVKFAEEHDFNKYPGIVLLCDSISEEEEYDIVMQLRTFNTTDRGIYPIKLNSVPFIRQRERDDINGLMNGCGEVTLELKRTTFHFDGTDEKVTDYISYVEDNASNIGSGFDLEQHKERMQRIRGGYATIMTAGATEAEAEERRDRIADAILAAQSALREGYVRGGGNHYLELWEGVSCPEYLSSAVTEMLTAVYAQIHYNSGLTTTQVDDLCNRHSSESEYVIEQIDFSGSPTKIPVSEFSVIDSAGTPIRVFEATRSLMHTLLPLKEHVQLRPSALNL